MARSIRNQRFRKKSNATHEEVLEQIKLGNLNGIFNTINEYETMPTYESAEAETVLPRKIKQGNNSYIIFGKDRPADLTSGFGGKGIMGSNCIDIVVGLASSHKDQAAEYFDQTTMVGKNVFTDAARIYISQRTDLEHHFGLVEPKFQEESKTKGSGIAIKADHVAMLGRKTITIRAGQAHGKNLGANGETDADGRKIDTADNRILLIGSQGLKLEPVVRGEKLQQYLNKLSEYIQKNTSAIMELQGKISKLRLTLARHTHVVPTPGGLALPSGQLILDTAIKTPEDALDTLFNFNSKLRQTLDEINSLGTEDGIKLRNNILSKTVFTT